MVPACLRAACKAKLVRVVTETGPRKRNVLVGLSGGDESILDELLKEGAVVMMGSKKGAVYGAPEQSGKRATRRG